MLKHLIIFVICVGLAVFFAWMIYNGINEMSLAKEEIASFEARGCTPLSKNVFGDVEWWDCPQS